MTGTLALVGGAAWTEGCSFDAELLRVSGGDRVVVIPTAAAYEQPRAVVETATAWFGQLGASVEAVWALRRSDALAPGVADPVRDARFVYISGGSPMHLRSVLKDTPLWDAIVDCWHRGGVVAASGEAAAVLCTHMVDNRGGAFTVGLDLLDRIVVVDGLVGAQLFGEYSLDITATGASVSSSVSAWSGPACSRRAYGPAPRAAFAPPPRPWPAPSPT